MGVKKFIWDELSDNVLLETDENDVVTAAYHHRPERFGELLSQNRSGVDRFFHFDGQHSTSDLTASNEKVTDTFSFTAYGEEVTRTGNTTNPFGYKGAVGYHTNEETHDVYVRNRTYEPAAGRWLSADPLGFIDGPNLFRAYFVPSHIDPSGLLIRFDFTPVGEKKCGQRLGARFQFMALGNYDKYIIIQRMEVHCDHRSCLVNLNPDPFGQPNERPCDCFSECPMGIGGGRKFVFYEVFKPGHTDFDTWSAHVPKKGCGFEKRFAEAKVITSVPKHIDQLFDFSPQIGPHDCRFEFKPIYQQPTAEEDPELAKWWSTVNSPEATSKLEATWQYNCCPHCYNYVDFELEGDGVHTPPVYPGDGLPPR